MSVADKLTEFDTDMLNATCTIEQPTDGALDAIGNPARTWDDVATGVACSVQPGSNLDQSRPTTEFVQDSQVVYYDYIIYIEFTASFTPNNRMRISAVTVDSVVDSRVFEIQAVLDDVTYRHHWVIGARTVEL